jgi:hypothetical protein
MAPPAGTTVVAGKAKIVTKRTQFFNNMLKIWGYKWGYMSPELRILSHINNDVHISIDRYITHQIS